MTCCIEIDTPQSIYDDGNDYYDEGTDVFAEIVGDTYDNSAVMQSALWAKYRYYMIGSTCTDRWVQAMKDRMTLIGAKWDAIFSKLADSDPTDIHEVSYSRQIDHTPIGDGDESVSVSEREDLPQTATSATKYLSARNTDTVSVKPNNRTSETYTEDRDIAAITLSKMITGYPDYLDRFCDEFSGYFIMRW